MAVAGPSVELTDGKLRLSDPGEGVAVSLGGTFHSVVESTSSGRFYFPVETAVCLRASSIRVPKLVDVYIMRPDGETITQAVNKERISVPKDDYLLRILSLGVVCYLRVQSAVETYAEAGERVLSFEQSDLEIGVRSYHDSPKATVQATEDPQDIMRAISCFGSALQTTTPERSWPSLRGCPPFVNVGATTFEAPPGLERTDTPVHVEVPPELRYIYPVASLAMYLDATVKQGSKPLLVADGVEHDLEGPEGFERTVQRTLEQVFFFDCVSRTDGLYLLDLYERSIVDGRSSLDLSSLYSKSLATQINAYLSEPWELIEDLLPHWKLTADVAPVATHAGYLPFAVNDLAHVRVPANVTTRETHSESGSELISAVADFQRTSPVETPGEFQATDPAQPSIVTAEPVGSIEHAWVGEGVPIGASKPTIASSRRQLEPIGSESVSVQVIVNDSEMRGEGGVSELYGLRDLIEMGVAIDEDQTVEETRSLLTADTDFVHFIGHATDAGLQCSDGYLDARTLDTVGMRAFVLNACRSYQQGRALVDAGAIGGVVTLSNVTNTPATAVGRQIAQLLNAGFSLGAALDVIGSETVTGRQYVIVGDGNATLAEPKAGVVICFEMEQSSDGFGLAYKTYPTGSRPLGGTFTPHLGNHNKQYLNGRNTGRIVADRSEIRELFENSGRLPVLVDGSLRWSDQIWMADDV